MLWPYSSQDGHVGFKQNSLTFHGERMANERPSQSALIILALVWTPRPIKAKAVNARQVKEDPKSQVPYIFGNSIKQYDSLKLFVHPIL